jgi:hypothetical protein
MFCESETLVNCKSKQTMPRAASRRIPAGCWSHAVLQRTAQRGKTNGVKKRCVVSCSFPLSFPGWVAGKFGVPWHDAKDSTIEKLVRMVEEAQTEKGETQRFLDRAEQFYAAGVILFTIGLIIVPVVFLKEAFQPAFYRAMTVMVVASPCALIISTPASILSAIGGAARRGVLFKGSPKGSRASPT